MNNLPVLSAILISFVVTALVGFWLIPILRKLKYGQTILDIGPKWHKNKQGTPTMGGILFIIGILCAVAVGYSMLLRDGAFAQLPLDGVRILLGLIMALGFGLIGFVDDYIKVVKRRNMGLTAKQKMVLQFLVAIFYIGTLYLAGDRFTLIQLPFLPAWDIGVAYFPLAVVGIVFLVNVVNLTDGIDGLCASVTFMVALGFLVLASLLRLEGMSMMAGALAGGCIGFLVWNFYPARVFMGDTGSLFLGGMVVALAFGIGKPAYLVLMGLIYIIEGLSVMIQMAYFKYTRKTTGTGKRLFKMSPIHHHFEMSGWSEGKIVVIFSVLQLLCCILSVVAATKV